MDVIKEKEKLLGKKKRTRKQIGKASRNKGKVGERFVANMLKARGFEARRGVQYKGGMNSPDVICESLDFFNFEVKWVEALSLVKAMNQCIEDKGPDQIPVVVHKKSRTVPLVTMRFTDWIDLVQWALNYKDKLNMLEIDRDKHAEERRQLESTDSERKEEDYL